MWIVLPSAMIDSDRNVFLVVAQAATWLAIRGGFQNCLRRLNQTRGQFCVAWLNSFRHARSKQIEPPHSGRHIAALKGMGGLTQPIDEQRLLPAWRYFRFNHGFEQFDRIDRGNHFHGEAN